MLRSRHIAARERILNARIKQLERERNEARREWHDLMEDFCWVFTAVCDLVDDG